MDNDKKNPKDNNQQRQKSEDSDEVLSTEHENQGDNGDSIETFQQISREEKPLCFQLPENTVSVADPYIKNATIKDVSIPDAENKNDKLVQTELTLDPKVTVSIIVAKNEELSTENTFSSSGQRFNLELYHTKPETSETVQVISVEQQNTLNSQISIIQSSDESIANCTPIKKLEEAKKSIMEIITSIDEVLKRPAKSTQNSHQLVFQDKENTSKIQLENIIKPDPTPSISYEVPSEEKCDSNLDFTPDSGPYESPSGDPCYFEELQKYIIPSNKDVLSVGYKLILNSGSETKEEKKEKDRSDLVRNLWPKENLMKLEESNSSFTSLDYSQNSENILDQKFETSPNELIDNNVTSQSTQSEQDTDKTTSSIYQSALDNSIEFVSSDNLNIEQDNIQQKLEHSQNVIGTAPIEDNDNCSKSESTQAKLKSTDVDISQPDDTNSVGEALSPKPLLLDQPDKEKQEKDLQDDTQKEVLLQDKTQYKSEENKQLMSILKTNDSMDPKLFLFPIDWSTVSDFNVDSLNTRNIVHSTPIKDIKIQEIIESISSTYPQLLKDNKIKSSPNLKPEERTEKELAQLKSSSSLNEEFSDDGKVMDTTDSQMDWFWLPANQADFFLPSISCSQILIGEDTHSDSSSRVDESENETLQSDTKTVKSFKMSSKEDLHLASGDAPTENKTFDRPEIEVNKTFDRPKPVLNTTFVREGPELNKKLGEQESELDKTFKKPFSDLKKQFNIQLPEISSECSTSKSKTFVKSEPVLVKEFKNKGWDNIEESSSFYTLNLIIHGFYDLYDIPKYSPRSLKLSTIYEVSESDSNISISQSRVDAAQQAKIREFSESLIEARNDETLYYDMGSVMTCISENPFSTIDEFFVLGKYKLLSDEGSDKTDSTLKAVVVKDLANPSQSKLEKEIMAASMACQYSLDEQKFVSSSTSDLNIIKEEIPVDTDLEMFCKQELDKFPKDNLGIRFKQIIKFNGKIIFDCRCNYDELPLKLRRKYEKQDHLLLEFNHLIIPDQRKVYFSLHCCRHTIEEMLQIICITDKNKYIYPACVEELVSSYRSTYINSQLTHIPETLPCSIVEPKFFSSIIDENSKNKFVQDWLNTSRAESQTNLEQASGSGSGFRGRTEYAESEGESFINLHELEEYVNSSSLQFPARHTYLEEEEEEDDNN